MPDVTVEVAFASAPGAEVPTWTDVSADWMSIEVNRGRGQELDHYQAGTCSVVLKDTARKYDPSNAASPYFPNVQPMKRLRVRAVWDAVTYDVFHGFVESYDHEYDGPPNGMATCTVRAVDGFAVLAAAELPASVYALEVAADAPALWWRLGEPQGSATLNDSSGNQRHGTPSGTLALGAASQIVNDSDTAAEFSEVANSFIRAPLALSGTTPFAVELWFTLTAVPSFMQTLFISTDSGVISQNLVQATINSVDGIMSVVLYNTAGTGFSVLTPSPIVTGTRYHLVVTHAADRILRIYLNGALVATGSGATSGTFTSTEVHLGSPSAGASPRAIVDEFALYSGTIPSAARIATHNTAGRTPWDDDTPGVRLGKIFDYLGWPAALRSLDAGSVTLQSAELGLSVLEHAQKVADSDFGALFMTAGGAVRFIGREGLFNRPALATFGDDPGDPAELGYRSIRPENTAQLIRNDVTVSRYQGTAQRVQDAASIAAYLRRTYTVDGLLHDSDALSLAAAEFLTTEYKDPRRRVSSMVVTPRGDPNRIGSRPEDLFPAVLGRELADQIEVQDRPPGGGAVNVQDSAIEGIAHTITPLWWETEWALAPAIGSAGVGTVWTWDVTKWDEHRWGF